jgi:hypothetical protein
MSAGMAMIGFVIESSGKNARFPCLLRAQNADEVNGSGRLAPSNSRRSVSLIARISSIIEAPPSPLIRLLTMPTRQKD